MFDDLIATYQENVLDSYIEYREFCKYGAAGCSLDLRKAVSAASALFHFREHLPNDIPTRKLIESLCPDYGLLGDVVNASKHKNLQHSTPHGDPLISNANRLCEKILIIVYKDDIGEYTFTSKTVEVKLDDGTKRNLLDVLTNVINFWEEYLVSLGKISEAHHYRYENPIRARTRTECERNRIEFELVRGRRFSQQFQMIRYNIETGEAEPIDLSNQS